MARYSSGRCHGSHHRVDSVIIHTSKICGAELKKRKPPSSWLLTWQGQTAPLSAYQYAMTANLYLKLFRHVTPRLSASDGTTGKAPPSASGFQVITEYQANETADELAKAAATSTTHITCTRESPHRTTIDPPPNRPERPWCTKISPGRQTASPHPTGQVPLH